MPFKGEDGEKTWDLTASILSRRLEREDIAEATRGRSQKMDEKKGGHQSKSKQNFRQKGQI